jgi:hypothetical protein
MFQNEGLVMETLIVYMDDADYAQRMLSPMLAPNAPTRWVLVACAPRMSRRIGKWLSHSARENWRGKWCDRLFTQVTPLLQSRGVAHADTEYVVAKEPLLELTQQLRSRLGAARVVDARRPKLGQDMQSIAPHQPHSLASRWQVPGAALTAAAE